MKHNMKKNLEDRMWFVKYWAEYIKTIPDEEWSEKQNELINAIIK